MNNLLGDSIGGYFGLELPLVTEPIHSGTYKYQSARVAFLALLSQLDNVDRVWMPHFICASMISAVDAVGKELCFYSIDLQFSPVEDIALGDKDILLYVNYFGVCGVQVKKVLDRFNPMQVIIDASQALYMAPENCLATIYSPRKFVGIPDGGLLASSLVMTSPIRVDISSESRMAHLINSWSFNQEYGYAAFQRAEASLEEMSICRMSKLTERLISSVDFEKVKIRRNKNFEYLSNELAEYNTLNSFGGIDGPLCFPFLPRISVSRAEFIKRKIFMPTYWPEVIARVDLDSVEATFVNQLLAIPCDQRYTETDLERIINLYRQLIN